MEPEGRDEPQIETNGSERGHAEFTNPDARVIMQYQSEEDADQYSVPMGSISGDEKSAVHFTKTPALDS